MSCPSLKYPTLPTALSIFLWGIVVRLVTWQLFGQEHLTFSRVQSKNYVTALNDHLWSFLYYTHTKPPGAYLRDAILIRIFEADNLNFARFFLTSLADCITATLLFLILRSLRIPFGAAVFSALLWSITLISWEYWRTGSNWNHLNPLFVALLAYFTCLRIHNQGLLSDLAAGLTSGCFILLYSPAPILVFIMLVSSQKQLDFSSKTLWSILATYTCPMLIFAAVIEKNVAQFDLYSTSSNGGQNMLQSLAIAQQNLPKINAMLSGQIDVYDEDHAIDNVRLFAEENGAPSWWLWCFDEAQVRFDNTPIDRYIAGIYGTCTTQADGSYDFFRLIDHLSVSRQLDLKNVAIRDSLLALRTPWILSGIHSDHGLTTHFGLAYARESAKLWLKFLVKEPYLFTLQLLRSHFIYFVYGSNFFSGHQYEGHSRPRPSWVIWSSYVFIPVFLVGSTIAYLLVVIHILACVNQRIKAYLAGEDRYCRSTLFIFSIGICITGLAVNFVHCCENARMFVTLTPLILPIGFHFIWSRVYRRRSLSP